MEDYYFLHDEGRIRVVVDAAFEETKDGIGNKGARIAGGFDLDACKTTTELFMTDIAEWRSGTTTAALGMIGQDSFGIRLFGEVGDLRHLLNAALLNLDRCSGRIADEAINRARQAAAEAFGAAIRAATPGQSSQALNDIIGDEFGWEDHDRRGAAGRAAGIDWETRLQELTDLDTTP